MRYRANGAIERIVFPEWLDEDLFAGTAGSARVKTWNETLMVAEADILAALKDCFDPEVKLNLVDLGLIYGVETGPDPDSTPKWPRQWVRVQMTLTTPQCPACGLIFGQVENRLRGMPDISTVEVALGWEPKWTPHRISEAGRRQLGI